MSDLWNKALALVQRRQTRRRMAAYRELFGPQLMADGERRFSPAQKIVLADLERFCFANYPTFDPDPGVHRLKEGQRAVWLRIQHFLQIEDRDLREIRENDHEDDD